MAKKRKFVAYRRMERPYTRKSKYREKSFIRASPPPRIIRYNMGNPHMNAEYTLKLVSDRNLQVRDVSLESTRLIINRHCEKHFGRNGFYMRLRVYPHHHLRENALASGAGADRLSTGMKCSFGKVIGVAAQIKENQEILELHVGKQHLDHAKRILKMCKAKLPCSPRVVVVKNEKHVMTADEKRLMEKFSESNQKADEPVEEETTEETPATESTPEAETAKE